MSNLFFKEKNFIKRLKYLFKTLKGRHFMLPHKTQDFWQKKYTDPSAPSKICYNIPASKFHSGIGFELKL